MSRFRTTELAKFIRKRENVRLAKEAGAPKPWTTDAILQRYRFCNVNRENDKVTKWIADNWRTPNHDDPDLWFAMAVARWNNWPDTLARLGYPVPWKPTKFVSTVNAIRDEGGKAWTGAYMIGTQGNAMDKPLFIAEGVLSPLWAARKSLRPRAGDTLRAFAERIIAVKNQGKFMVGQIVADLKYAQLTNADDWFTWAVSGPGSRRGLNRVMGRDLHASWNEAQWFEQLSALRVEVENALGDQDGGMIWLHAQDLQNCLCEFDKYERVRLGEGKPRSTYQGAQ